MFVLLNLCFDCVLYCSCLFLVECLALHGACTILETYFPEVVEYYEHADQVSLSSNDSETGLTSPESPARASSMPSVYTDTLKMKMRAQLVTLYKAAETMLKTTMRKDKSFADLWPLVDQMFALFVEHSLKLVPVKKELMKLNTNMELNHGTVTNRTGAIDDDSLMSQSFDFEEKAMIEQQFQSIERRLRLQRKRFELIQNWFVHFYADKNWINCFI